VAIETMKNKSGLVIGYRAKPYYKGKALKGYSKTFPTKGKARAYIDGVLTDIRGNVLVDRTVSETMTLHQALDEYWDDVGQYKKGADALRRRVNKLKELPLASLPLSAIKTSDVLTLQNKLLETKQPSTVINDMSPLVGCINHAKVKHDMPYLSNPCGAVKFPSTRGNERNRRLSKAERKALLIACYEYDNDFILPVVLLAIELGLRQERLVGLRWEQVDFHRKVVRYEKSLSLNKGVPLSAPFTKRMERLLIKLHKMTGDGEYVFDASLPAIRTAFKRARNRSGVENFRFHDLRHEAISRMFAEGLEQVDIMKITGIKSAQTLARYTHPSDEYLVSLRYK